MLTALGLWAEARLGIQLVIILSVSITPFIAAADQKPFASNWWEEYGPDEATIRLFHFGRPEELPWEHMVPEGLVRREEEREEEQLLEEIAGLDAEEAAIEAASEEGLVEDVAGEAERERLAAPIEEPHVPTDRIYDYSDARAIVEVADGVTVTPDGRFGAGLAFDGDESGQTLIVEGDDRRLQRQKNSVAECWIKVPKLPEKPACIISVGDDESRFLLNPDGHLEIWRKQPHGYTRVATAERIGERHDVAAIKAYMKQDIRIRSDRPIPVGEWVHVAYGRGLPSHDYGFIAYMWINGEQVAQHQACRFNHYNFMSGGSRLVNAVL